MKYFILTSFYFLLLGSLSAQTWCPPTYLGTQSGIGGNIGQYSSLLIVNGNPAIAYYDMSGHNLVFKRATDASGTSWGNAIVIDASGDVGLFLSLQIVNGNPAISYHDILNGSLKYVRATDASGISWGSPVAIDVTGNTGTYTSLQVVNGNPAITYYASLNQDLKYVRATDASGTSWGTPVAVDVTGNVGQYSSLQIVNGNPAISYYAVTGTSLKYVRATDVSGTTWGSPLAIDAAGGQYTSMQIVNGNPAIAYYAGGMLSYVRAADVLGTTWGSPFQIEPNAGQYCSMQIVNGNPAISCYGSGSAGDLFYVRATDISGISWGGTQFIDQTGDVGKYTSLQIVNGNPAIAYYDVTNFDLKYMRATDASGTAWGSPSSFEGYGFLGYYNSLQIVNGNPAISCYDVYSTDLKYVRANDVSGTNWSSPVVIDLAGAGGGFTSMQIVNGYPAISYFDGTNADLKYVRANDSLGTIWGSPISIDITGSVGQYTSMKIVNGNPAISYYDLTNGDLKYVRATDISGTAWGSPVSIDLTGTVGYYTSLQIVNGNPAISYYDGTNADLKYTRAADLSGNTWGTPVSIDVTGGVGANTSLEIINGNPAISYSSSGPDNLKYVRATDALGTNWATPIVVDAGAKLASFYSSLQIINGNPAISYYDQVGFDLKYVRATDVSGATWGSPALIDIQGIVGAYSSMINTANGVGIAYANADEASLSFIFGALPPVISGNTTICSGSSVSLSGSGGTAYNWNFPGGTPAASTSKNPIIFYNTPGAYSFTLTTTNSCSTASVTSTVTVNSNPTVTISGSSTTVCSGSSSTLNASGATTYLWNTGASTISISISPSTNVTYTVTGTNLGGCSATNTISIAGHLPIPITATSTPTSCGNKVGTAWASVSGAGSVPPFSYLWNTGSTSTAINSLDAGIYRANVIDGNGCFSFADALVTSSNGPTLTTNTVAAVSCAGLSNGAIDINVTGGSQPYTFFWSDGTTTEDINNVSFGPYEVVVTDAGGCSVTKSIFVPEPAVLSVSSTVVDASCATANGSATAVAMGGNIPYTYWWSSGSSVASATGLAAGVYTVSVTDSKGCSDSLLVGVQNSTGPLVAIDTISAANCGASGFILIIPQDSGAIASYIWTTGSTTQNLNNASAGNYGLVITDTTGCKSTLVVPVTPVLPPLKPICIVTVDTLSNLNILVWDKPVSTFIQAFNIYRESSQNGIYQLIASQSYSVLSTYYDSVANPSDRWAKYRISIKDICGKEGPLSKEHKTIHLSIQSSTPDSTTLIWDDYVGYAFAYYHIFRKDSTSGSWYLLDSVPETQTTYIDTAVPHTGDTIYYHIDVSHGGGDCVASLKNPEPEAATVKSSKSNSSERTTSSGSSVAEISANTWITVYPNPNNGTFSISSSKYTITGISIYNLLGEQIYAKNVNAKKADVTVPEIAKGIYHLQVITSSGAVNLKIVVTK